MVELLKYTIRKTSWLTVSFMTMAFMLVIGLIINHKSHVDFQRYLVKLDEHTEAEILLELGEAKKTSPKTKIIKTYNEIFITHGFRYRKNAKVKKAMDPITMARFSTRMYKYCKMLDVPYFIPISIFITETSGNPNAEGGIGELGIGQLHWTVVGVAQLFHKRMMAWNPSVGKELDFKYLDKEDLRDPLNSLKIVMVLLWGLSRQYERDWIYVLSSYHWGGHRVDAYYADPRLEPPEIWVFNPGTIKEDVRNIWSYSLLVSRLETCFKGYYAGYRKTLDIGLPEDYIAEYQKQASRAEAEYIQNLRYMKTIIKEIDKLKELKTKEQKSLEKIERMTKKYHAEYLEVSKLIKKGDYKEISTMWAIAKSIWKKYITEITQDERLKTQKYVLYGTLAVVAIMLILSIMQTITIIRWIIRKIRNRFKRKR